MSVQRAPRSTADHLALMDAAGVCGAAWLTMGNRRQLAALPLLAGIVLVGPADRALAHAEAALKLLQDKDEAAETGNVWGRSPTGARPAWSASNSHPAGRRRCTRTAGSRRRSRTATRRSRAPT